MNRQIGKVTRKIIEILDLKYNKEEPIFIGEANILHMKKEHPDDFNKYSDDIEEIITFLNFKLETKSKVCYYYFNI